LALDSSSSVKEAVLKLGAKRHQLEKWSLKLGIYPKFWACRCRGIELGINKTKMRHRATRLLNEKEAP
jgi:hypothetical protein